MYTMRFVLIGNLIENSFEGLGGNGFVWIVNNPVYGLVVFGV